MIPTHFRKPFWFLVTKSGTPLEKEVCIEIHKWKIVYTHNSPKRAWGRFGGGWNWKVGIMVGSQDLILECLVFYIRFGKRRIV